MSAAPSTASLTLLTYQQPAITSGTPAVSWAMRCAGRIASSGHIQARTGQSNSAASRMAFGGQSSETALAAGVNASPTRTPR